MLENELISFPNVNEMMLLIKETYEKMDTQQMWTEKKKIGRKK